MDRTRKIDLALSILAIALFVLAGFAYLQAAATYTLSFTFCTEPGTANALTPRCRAPLLYGYAFWGFMLGGVILSIVAIVRGRRRRFAAAAA